MVYVRECIHTLMRSSVFHAIDLHLFSHSQKLKLASRSKVNCFDTIETGIKFIEGSEKFIGNA